MKPKIISFGEIIWDVYESESLIGGAGLNFAAHCLRCGADSFLFSAVGRDELGIKAESIISDFNVDRRFIKSSDKTTGKCIVKLDEKGVPDFNVLDDTAFDNITVSDADICEVNKIGFDALYFGTLIQRSPVSRSTLKELCKRCSFKEIVCDVNLRKNCYDADSAKFCLENATILKISQEEEPLLRELKLYFANSDSPEKLAAAISGRYPQIKYIIFTLGENGSFVYCAKSKKDFQVAAKRVAVASTVGAGDSFIAAWITAYLSGVSIEESTKLASELSGFVVSRAEAIPDYTMTGGVLNEKI
ncbi:MAG: hypothetical protein J6C82_08050 [Clostridia bacterium]|nr:hypothetical protein [Clostridia bacterium]